MSFKCTAISKGLWLFPVVAACSPPTDIAKQAGVGGNGAGGASATLIGGSSAAPTGGATIGGSSAAPTGGVTAAPIGGSSAAPVGGSSTLTRPASGGSNLAGGGTLSAGGSINVGGNATTSNTQICSNLSETDCSAKQEQCTSTYGYTGPMLSGTRSYAGCHTGWGCTAAITCAYPAGQPEGCLVFASGCIPDGWVQDASCNAPTCPSPNHASGGATGAGGTSGTAGAAGTGGNSSGGTHSRVIVVDPGTNSFGAYDAEGQLVHDYAALLDFGSNFDSRVVCIDTLDYSWDGTASDPFFATSVLAPPGQEPPPAPTELIVTARAVNATKAMAKVRVANISGQVTDEFSILGDWQGFLSSPSRQYLQGGISGSTGIIVRRSDHGTVWQGPLYQAGFSPDDKHLIVIAASSENSASTVELATGLVTNLDLSKLPAGFESPTDVYIRGTFNSGAVLTANRRNGAGSALYWAGWDGTLSPLDRTLPAGAQEWTVTANRDGSRVAFLRTALSAATVEPSLLGWFEVDTATNNLRALPRLNDTSQDCYDPNVTTYYTLTGGTLSSCSCATAACDTFASWTPPSDTRWEPELVVSPQRGFVGVQYLWMSQTVATSSTPARLYNAAGALLVSVDSGMYGRSFAFDTFDQLALISTYTSTIDDSIFNPASGHTSSLGNPRWLAFGYE